MEEKDWTDLEALINEGAELKAERIEKEKAKIEKKERKKSTTSKAGMRLLKFEKNEDKFTPLKNQLIDIFNDKNCFYIDFYKYCAENNCGGDLIDGTRLANSIISGMPKNKGFTDTTLLTIVGFLGLEIKLVKKED